MFHVKHSFMSVWRHYTESLRQRNSALRQHANTKEITAWDQGLVHYGTQLDAMYAEYCLELIPYVETMVGEMLDLTFQFAYQGCNQAEMDYAVALQNALDRDLSLGYTTFGPHRADLQIRLNGMPAQDVLSRGQQKLLVSAMRLAQGQLLSEKLSKQSIYLIDDLAAELDDQHCTRLIQQLLNLKAQVFMTGIQLSTFASLQQEASSVMFHVKHGEVSQVTR
jgi:DNA replication and repair protein RecF